MTRQSDHRLARILVLSLLMVMLGSSLAWACPNCKDAMAGDPAQAGLIRGLFWSILFMISMPFLILGGLSSYFYWEVCRARRAAREAAIEGPRVGKSPFAPPSVSADEPSESLPEDADELEPVGAGR